MMPEPTRNVGWVLEVRLGRITQPAKNTRDHAHHCSRACCCLSCTLVVFTWLVSVCLLACFRRTAIRLIRLLYDNHRMDRDAVCYRDARCSLWCQDPQPSPIVVSSRAPECWWFPTSTAMGGASRRKAKDAWCIVEWFRGYVTK